MDQQEACDNEETHDKKSGGVNKDLFYSQAQFGPLNLTS
jgi:hypothetical protein